MQYTLLVQRTAVNFPRGDYASLTTGYRFAQIFDNLRLLDYISYALA